MTDTKTTAKSDIRQRLTALMREDSAKRSEALRAISVQTRPAFKALEIECGETGHKWTFASYNWDRSYVWDKCVWCGTAEGADKHAEPESNG